MSRVCASCSSFFPSASGFFSSATLAMVSATSTGVNLSGVSVPEQPASMDAGDIVMPMSYRFVAGADQQTQLLFFRRYGANIEE